MKTVWIIDIVVLILMLALAIVYYYQEHPSDDPEVITQCVESHQETRVDTVPIGVKLGNGPLHIHMETICDRYQDYHCSNWEVGYTRFAHKPYMACRGYK